MNVKSNRTGAYAGTFNYHCPEDLAKLAELRAEIRKKYGDAFHVKLQGRLGKNRPTHITEKYRKKSRNWRANFAVELKDSAYADAYVYRRSFCI